MVRSLGLVALGLLVTTAAHGEQPGSGVATASEPAGEPACAAPASPAPAASAVDAEERAFYAELESFVRRKAFTDRMIAQRNAELFEQAIALNTRAARLQRELTEQERARSEREFEEALALYLKKRELTRARSTAARASDHATSPSSAPSSPAP